MSQLAATDVGARPWVPSARARTTTSDIDSHRDHRDHHDTATTATSAPHHHHRDHHDSPKNVAHAFAWKIDEEAFSIFSVHRVGGGVWRRRSDKDTRRERADA
jgi:hypothetical protein